MKYNGDNGQNSTGVLITLTEPEEVCAAAAGATAAMQQHFSALATAQCTVNKKKKKTIVTRASQVVPHPSTDRARPCLTSQIRRDAVRSQ